MPLFSLNRAQSGSMEVVLGQRVSAPSKGANGTVRFIGEAEFAAGKWIGVELDEPKGKVCERRRNRHQNHTHSRSLAQNNGTVNDRVYFTCAANHGVFLRQSQIEPIANETPAKPFVVVHFFSFFTHVVAHACLTG